MRSTLFALALVAILGGIAALPPAEATDCLPTGIPVCPVGAVPWPRSSSNSCGSHGVSWSCAWIW